MISSMELRYVNSWASKIPMPGYDYSKMVIDNIKRWYEMYENRYKDKEYYPL